MDSWDIDAHSCHLLLDHVQLPWFHWANLPGSYVLYSIRLSPPGTSTTEHHFFTGPGISFFLEPLVIALHSFSAAYWTPSDLENSSSSVIYFCLFILFMQFSWQKYWSCWPFSPPVDHTCQNTPIWSAWPWVALHSIAHSFIELHKPLYHDKDVIYEGD